MKVTIQDWGIPFDIKRKGIQIGIADTSGHQGNLYITMSNLIWCKGRTTKPRGRRLNWTEFMELMDNFPKVRRALKKLRQTTR